MVKKAKKVAYPFPLRVLQVVNYFIAVFSAAVGLLYLFASKAILTEFNGSEPSRQYVTAVLYFVLAGLAAYVAYLFRVRNAKSVEVFIIANVLAYAILAAINHNDNYVSSLSEEIFNSVFLAIIIVYLLFSSEVKTYFKRK